MYRDSWVPAARRRKDRFAVRERSSTKPLIQQPGLTETPYEEVAPQAVSEDGEDDDDDDFEDYADEDETKTQFT